MPHEKIYRKSEFGTKEVRVVWGLESFPDHMFLEIHINGKANFMSLKEDEADYLISVLKKARKKTWVRKTLEQKLLDAQQKILVEHYAPTFLTKIGRDDGVDKQD